MPSASSARVEAHKPSAAGLRLTVKVQPGCRRTAFLGLIEIGESQAALKIALTAPPVDGKANAALIALLAQAFGLPKRAQEQDDIKSKRFVV